MRVAACCLALQVTLLATIQPHDGYVNDFASVLADTDETYLEDYLRTLERDTSAEVAVATVTSLDGMTIEEYANRLFAAWGIGKKQRDNGVLVLVAVRDRQVRIEVGYGLEEILPDGRVGEIIRTSIVPEFRAGNIPRGIGQGIDRLARIIRERGEPASPRETAVPQVAPKRSSVPVALVAVPFMGVFVAIAAFFAGTGISTRTVGPLAFAALFGGVPLALATAFLSPWWVALLLLLGGVVMAVGYRVGRSPSWLAMLRTGKESAREDAGSMPWIMGATSNTSSDVSVGAGGSSSGGDSSSSSSSSDFGGGSSGGGGASGSWQ
jgi:uncharacterized protein